MTPPLPTIPPAALEHLSENDPVMRQVISNVGPCVIVPIPRINLFQALMRSIVYQQLHAKAAATIHSRVAALMPKRKVHPVELAKLPDAALRGAGLSSNKLLALRDLAKKTLEGTVPSSRQMSKMDDAELIERLTAIRGIGPWTVHMLMIFTLGRPDVLPTSDFAINKAFSRLYRKGRPFKPEALIKHAKRWQPYRSIASWYLWRSLDLN